MAEDEATCLAQAQEFHIFATKFIDLIDENGETMKQELNSILDNLNSLDYTFETAEREEAERVLCQGTYIIEPSEEFMLIKFCKLVVNLITKQKINPSISCVNALVEYFVGVLRSCQSSCFPQVLIALSALMYECKNKFEEYWECLAGPDGLLINLASNYNDNDKDPNLEIKIAALKCLETFTYRCPNESYIGESCVEACFKVFHSALHVGQGTDVTTVDHCKMMVSVLRGLQNLITNSKNIHLTHLGSILASLKEFSFHGLPGYPNNPTSPDSISTSFAQCDLTEGDDQKTSSLNKMIHAHKSKRKPWQMTSESQPSTNIDTYAGTLSSIWTPRLSNISPSPSNDSSSSWVKISSSESEYSDGETGGQFGKNRIFQSKVRMCAHMTLQSVIKNTDKKIIFGYMPSFLPDSPTCFGVPQSQTLLTSILKDPSPKVRTNALAVLTAFLDGSKQYLVSADDSERHHMAFIPFSLTLAHMLKELHRCLLLALVAETSSLTLTQLIKCLSTYILNVPFHKLSPGLLTKLSRHLRQFLNHRDSNVRVAALTCFGSLLSLQPPTIEVTKILMDESPASAYSLSLADDPVGTRPPENVKRKNSSPISIEMHQAFDAMIGAVGKVAKEPWLLHVCQENIYSLSDSPDVGDVIVKTNPLPVRLESLQVLSILTKGYFFILRSNLNQLANLIHSCLMDDEPSVRLHGARLFEQLGFAMSADLSSTGDSSGAIHTPDYVSITVEEIVSVWLRLLDGPLPSALQNTTLPSLRATGCDCLANIGSRPFDLLPPDYRNLCLNVILGLISDADNGVKSEAVRALGVYVLFPTLREDIGFLADAANAIITAMEDANVNVRIKACWALGNLSDAFVLNSAEGNDLFAEELSDRLLYNVCTIAINAALDNDKVKSNAVRAIGNLLRFMGEKTVAKTNFLHIIQQSVQMLIKNITLGNNMKVRWNACYAAGNLFRNSAIPFDKSEWVYDLLKALTCAIKECRNFKVRTNAAIAFTVPAIRSFYGSTTQFSSLWEDIVKGLLRAQEIDSFTEYKYQDNLLDQLCFTLCRLTSLVTTDDLVALHPVLIEWKPQVKDWMEKFTDKLDTNKEEIVSKLFYHFEQIKTSNNDEIGQITQEFAEVFPKIVG
uniref:HEAT repeat-containing protein 6 n=1 Tax=Strigamia maritima TaxID=126957 RepID=T1J2K0_STRMM